MSAPRIKLSQKQAEAWRQLDRPEIAEVFAGGGAGGGKSWLGCLRQIYRRATYAETIGFIGRADFTALRDSTMKTYFRLLQTMGYVSNVHYRYNAQEHIIYFENGSEQHFRHMSYQPSDPDYNRFGSTEYTDAFIDEAPEVQQRAVEIVLSRLRLGHAKHGITRELLLTGNPTDNWVKYRYVMDIYGQFVALPSHRSRVLFTIADNPDTELRDSYTKTLDLLEHYDRQRLLFGDWNAKPNIERPFAIQYDKDRHNLGCHFQPNRTLYISFDFNLDPFAIIFSHIWEDVEGLHYHIFDEMSIQGGTLANGVKDILAKYGNHRHMMVITGDYNGTARQMAAPDGLSHYLTLKRMIGLTDRQFDIRPNPRHSNSRSDCNFILANAEDLRVSPNCVHLERDLRTVEVDSDEKIIKVNRSKIEQRADHLDAFRYLCNTKALQDWAKRKQIIR